MSYTLTRINVKFAEGPKAGQTVSFCQPCVIVGRAPDCHLVFSSEKVVSRHHCEIRQFEGRVELVDTNSTNGTYVGNERIQVCQLRSGDEIRVGYLGPLLKIDFEAGAPASEIPMAERYRDSAPKIEEEGNTSGITHPPEGKPRTLTPTPTMMPHYQKRGMGSMLPDSQPSVQASYELEFQKRSAAPKPVNRPLRWAIAIVGMILLGAAFAMLGTGAPL